MPLKRPPMHGGRHRKGLAKAVNKGTKAVKHLTTKKQRKTIGNAAAGAIASRISGMGRKSCAPFYQKTIKVKGHTRCVTKKQYRKAKK